MERVLFMGYNSTSLLLSILLYLLLCLEFYSLLSKNCYSCRQTLHVTMSLWMFYGNNRKQRRYLAILSCDFERSVVFDNHVPE